MHTRRRARRLALATTAALALVGGVAGPATAGTATADRTTGPSVTEGRPLYVPTPNPDALTHIEELEQAGQTEDAAAVQAMVDSPQAIWFTGQEDSDVQQDIAEVVRDAAARDAVPVLTLYNVPGRDCAQYSEGGAADTAEYQQWIDAVARGVGEAEAIVLLEPDSLALLPADCGQDDEEGSLTAARFTELNYAVDSLSALPGTTLYLDAGHSDWHTVGEISRRLVDAGVDRARGFYLNASNYRTDDELIPYGELVSGCVAHLVSGGDPADCPDQDTPAEEATAWLAEHVTEDPADQPHFVTDTSRNGQGPWTAPEDAYPDPQEWCNPPDRGLGQRPTTDTGHELVDAYLWIKIPGESDGECLRGTEGPEDPERGMVDPPAGGWFPEMALELVHHAQPPLQVGDTTTH